MKVYLWYFFAYAFMGWCTEVVFAALSKGKFVNRGFLNGPLCPIYGFGIVAVLLATQPFASSLPLLYGSAVVVTTVLELVTGFVMEKLFHHRWWDYSKMPFNIGGYVCALFSLVWGLACVMIVDVLHPRVQRAISWIPAPWDTVLLALFVGLFITDIIITVATLAKLNQRLKAIDEVAAALRGVSNKLGQTMADGALAIKANDELAMDELQSVKERTRAAVLSADEKAHAELKARRDELIGRIDIGQRRLLKAFPGLRSLQHPAALDALQKKLSLNQESKPKQ